MKAFLLLLVVLGCLGVVWGQTAALQFLKSTSQSEIDALIANPRVVEEFTRCFEGTGKCTSVQSAMRDALKDFALSGVLCRGCDDPTTDKLRSIVKKINDSHRAEFRQILNGFKNSKVALQG